MRTVAILMLCLACAHAGDKTDKRIHEIEFKFTLKFDQETEVGGKPVWIFMEPSLNTHVKILGIAVPVNATDKQIADCTRSAEFAFGWYEGAILNWVEEQKKKKVLEPESL